MKSRYKMMVCGLVISLLLVGCSNESSNKNQSTLSNESDTTQAAIVDAPPSSNPSAKVLEDPDQQQALEIVEQFINKLMSFDEDPLQRGTQYLDSESFRSTYINQVDYQLNIDDWTKQIGSKDMLPKVNTVTLKEIIVLNVPNEDYVKRLFLNVNISYDSTRYVPRNYQHMGFTINKKADNSKWVITGFNLNQHVQIHNDENGIQRWDVIPEPEEKEAAEIAKKAIKSVYNFSDRKSGSDTKGLEELLHPKYMDNTLSLMKENGISLFDSLTPEELPEVTNVYIEEILPIAEKLKDIDKAYYVSFSIVFNPNRKEITNTMPGLTVVYSNGKWLVYVMNDNVPPWEENYK